MDLEKLLREYESSGDERIYRQAKTAYEEALQATPDDAKLHHQYGYLNECHARNGLRRAAAEYERAIELEPEWAKPRYQLLAARAAVLEIDDAIRAQLARLAARPGYIVEYRLLASAYLLAQRPDKADETAVAGLQLAPDDAVLTSARGHAAAASGRTEEALAFWGRARALDPEDLSGEYGAAFLLEREGRIAEAAARWRTIIDWCTARGYATESEWPKRELARLDAKLGA